MAIKPISQTTYQQITSTWENVSNTSGESLTHIWAPISGAHRRVRQFVDNHKDTSQAKVIYIVIDANQNEHISYDEVMHILSAEIRAVNMSSDLEQVIKNSTKRITLFLLGFDTSLKSHNYHALQRISTLCEKYSQLCAILISELDIINTDIYTAFIAKSSFLQNMTYQALYSEEDSAQFLEYLEEKWDFSIPITHKQKFISDLGGHFLLVKEAARIIRDDKDKSITDVYTSPTFVMKIHGILEYLSINNRHTIIQLLKGQHNVNISDYVVHTRMVSSKGAILLPVFILLKDQILSSYNSLSQQNNNFDSMLTSTERDLWELLNDSETVKSREQIAQCIWGDNWEDKYSDWAIDQAIHRLRKKMLASNIPYEIQTKKGIGFVLIPSPTHP